MARATPDFASTHTITHTNPTGPAIIGITESSIENQYYTALHITGTDTYRSMVLISNTGAHVTRVARGRYSASGQQNATPSGQKT